MILGNGFTDFSAQFYRANNGESIKKLLYIYRN